LGFVLIELEVVSCMLWLRRLTGVATKWRRPEDRQSQQSPTNGGFIRFRRQRVAFNKLYSWGSKLRFPVPEGSLYGGGHGGGRLMSFIGSYPPRK
jgi:hypothetical protein